MWCDTNSPRGYCAVPVCGCCYLVLVNDEVIAVAVAMAVTAVLEVYCAVLCSGCNGYMANLLLRLCWLRLWQWLAVTAVILRCWWRSKCTVVVAML